MKKNTKKPGDGIAVVGMQGRFPGARNVAELWENLKNGVESISTFSDAEMQAAGVDPIYFETPGFVNRGSVLEDVDQFDAGFFGYSARDAETIDPQQRVFLECAWEGLEQAGYDPETFPGMIGVFAGSDQSSYLYQIYSNLDLSAYGYGGMMAIGNEKDYLATQVAYKLNLRGPSLAIQTSCSTSLVAVCVACQNLRHGYCDMAIAGGVGISVPQKKGYWYQPGGIVSPDGRCRPFDARGQGTVVGSGVGLVVLKRLSDALEDGDNVLAVIKGFALNNDGAAKVGYTAPSIEGQSQVIRLAQRMAEVEPDTIGYIEAHGTATALGDPVELAALTKAFRERTARKQFCAIGSLKSNVGHLSSASGVSGLIKGILTVQHGQIPPSLHYEQPNPLLEIAKTPFFVASKLTPWPEQEHPRRAGVSSFGVGGTNAHVVLEQAPTLERKASREKQVLVLSARSSAALEKITDNLATHLEQSPDLELADAAYTLQVGRRAFPHRRALVFERSDRAGMLAALRTRDPQRVHRAETTLSDRAVVFMFSGQGTQYVGMAAELYRTEPTFREHFDQCAELLMGSLGLDLRSVVHPKSEREKAEELLRQTALTQPALFALEYSLARLWMEWGVKPKAMVGHSIGEYVAACLAGVMTLEDALSVVAMRGQLMDSMPGGSMLAVPLPEAALQAVLSDHISLAAVNGPAMSVLSGPAEVITVLEQQFVAQGLPCRKLHTSHAFHSVMMEPVLATFVERLKRVRLGAPQIPYLSNLTGGWITPELATSPEYWSQHLRQTVRFADNLRELAVFPDLVLLEVGPGQTLGSLARQQGFGSNSQLILPSLPGAQERSVTDSDLLAGTVAQLWLSGVSLDWRGYHTHCGSRRVPLPTYPFERQRYWLGPLEEVGRTDGPAPMAQPISNGTGFSMPPQADAAMPETGGAADPVVSVLDIREPRPPVDTWFYAPEWKPAAPPSSNAPSTGVANECWLVLGGRAGLGAKIRERLAKSGCKVNWAVRGGAYARRKTHTVLRPGERADYDALVQDLEQRGELPTHVLHLWSLEGQDEGGKSAVKRFDAAQDRSFHSVVRLAQALAKAGGSTTVQIGVVTGGLHSVTGDEALRSDESTVLGACKVISQEYPRLRCRNIDILPKESANADALIRELSKEPFSAVVAYRKGQRWLENHEPIALAAPASQINLQEGGVYFFTGGLGNIALLLAEAIAGEVNAKFVLTGRSAFPPREEWDAFLQRNGSDPTAAKIRRLLKLEEAGSEVMVVQADAASAAEMAAAVKRTVATWGAIHGVIHGAANLAPDSFGPVGKVDRAAGDSHFRPKAHGLLILDELLREHPPHFVVMLSSLSAVLGGAGLACYAASNAYLDAVTREKNRLGKTKWITINWDAWTFTPGPSTENAIGPAEGQECFRRILASARPHVIVSVMPLADRVARWVELRTPAETAWSCAAPGAARSTNGSPPAANGSANGAVGGGVHARPSMSTPFVPPRTEIEKTITGVWEHLLGVAPLGIHDKFFELGGHSLLAIQLLARLGETFHLELPVQRIFEAPTIAMLAAVIEKEQNAPAAGAARTNGDASSAELQELVDSLSEDELEALLQEAEAGKEN